MIERLAKLYQTITKICLKWSGWFMATISLPIQTVNLMLILIYGCTLSIELLRTRPLPEREITYFTFLRYIPPVINNAELNLVRIAQFA